ncbi:11861_t:CDS:2 [Dentiscutata erythropus]|uniref:11861_t:CDS:1 n=1 Tax=Dentiscutata erythropus TaxID=1348616 RepID=A0A9N9F0E2_9GLOM|nr:11861_t:CDS:2 [Dentiscutata erythropus]
MVKPVNEVYSQVFGFISLSCWIVVITPQLYENYKRKSGSSISLALICTWIMGDLCDFTGAILQNLLLTTILIALYHSVVDIALLLQICYYRFRKVPISSNESNESTEELAASKPSQKSVRRSRFNEFIKIFSGFIIICLAGGIAYYFSSRSQGAEEDSQNVDQDIKLLPQIFGWTAAMFYCKKSFFFSLPLVVIVRAIHLL